MNDYLGLYLKVIFGVSFPAKKPDLKKEYPDFFKDALLSSLREDAEQVLVNKYSQPLAWLVLREVMKMWEEEPTKIVEFLFHISFEGIRNLFIDTDPFFSYLLKKGYEDQIALYLIEKEFGPLPEYKGSNEQPLYSFGKEFEIGNTRYMWYHPTLSTDEDGSGPMETRSPMFFSIGDMVKFEHLMGVVFEQNLVTFYTNYEGDEEKGSHFHVGINTSKEEGEVRELYKMYTLYTFLLQSPAMELVKGLHSDFRNTWGQWARNDLFMDLIDFESIDGRRGWAVTPTTFGARRHLEIRLSQGSVIGDLMLFSIVVYAMKYLKGASIEEVEDFAKEAVKDLDAFLAKIALTPLWSEEKIKRAKGSFNEELEALFNAARHWLGGNHRAERWIREKYRPTQDDVLNLLSLHVSSIRLRYSGLHPMTRLYIQEEEEESSTEYYTVTEVFESDEDFIIEELEELESLEDPEIIGTLSEVPEEYW